jgi:hypothetical protein
MKLDWVKDVSNQGVEAVNERKALVRSCQAALDVLKNILEKKIEEIDSGRTRKADYDSPNWALKQADYIGSIRAIKDVLTLLDQEENSK